MNTGTNVWSYVFFFVAAIALFGIITILVKAWTRYSLAVNKARETGGKLPSSAAPVIATLVCAFGFAIALILGWNTLQSWTTNSSDYEKELFFNSSFLIDSSSCQSIFYCFE